METPSAAAQIMVTVIPIVGIVCGFVLVLMYLILSYRQRVLMIEKGIINKAMDFDSFCLFAGLILFSLGVALLVFFAVKEGVTYALLSGLIPLNIGVSMLLFFVIRLRMKKNGNGG